MSMLLAESLAASDLRSQFVGLPDKFDIQTSNRLPMPSRIHPIPLRTKVLGVYATPELNTLKALFNLLFQLIFPASKA